MVADNEDRTYGELMRIDEAMPRNLPELPSIPSAGGVLRGVWFDVLRYEGARRVAVKYDEAWQAALAVIGTLKDVQLEGIELDRAVNRAKQIDKILEMDDRKLEAELELARRLPKLAQLAADAEEAKLHWEIARREQQSKPKDYEDSVFEKELDTFRRGLKEPKRLREELERYKQETIDKRGEAGLTSEDEDDFERAEELLNVTLDLREV